MLVIDDAVLLDVLAGTAAPALAALRRARQLATTGSWYWRAARASAGAGGGTLSRRIEVLSELAQGQVHAGLALLPPELTLISLRRLVPIMAGLPRQSNLLTMEAVAAACLLEADLLVSVPSDAMEVTAAAAGVVVSLTSTV